MANKWTDPEKEKSPMSEKIPDGKHIVKIAKILYGYESKAGDPKIMVIFAKGDLEATAFYTLSSKAEHFVIMLLKAANVDLSRMENDNLDLADLAKPEVSDNLLVGRVLAVEVEPGNGGYKNVTPLRREMYDTLLAAGETVPESNPF